MRSQPNFFGTTTVGKKGQVVIPVETRRLMKWQENDKLLVFGLDNGRVVLTKLDHVQETVNRLEKKMKKIKQLIKKSV
jgi:AbrB family looped-hinge helix DNA binding protein